MIGWLRRLAGRGRQERQLDAELRDHLERQIADNVASGLSAAEARRRAQVTFGGLDQVKEQCRDARGTRWLEDLARDLRYSGRLLRRSPVFTLTVVLSLALGIGGVTALFSVFNALALHTLDVPRPHRLVTMTVASADGDNPSFPYRTFDYLHTRTRTLAGLFATARSAPVNVGTRDASELASNVLVSGAYFQTLQVPAGLGRLIEPDDDRAGVQVAVLSDGYWRRRFGGDPAIVGQSLTINASNFTILGVTPPGFTGASIGSAPDLYFPLHARDRLASGVPWWDTPHTWLTLMGRLRDDVAPAQAQAELDALFQQAAREIASSSASPGARAGAADPQRRWLRLDEAATGADVTGLRQTLSRSVQALLGIAGALLLIASLNIANLLLARSAARRREMAVRLAIGAGRGRLIRQLLTETTLLTALGAAGGLALALWAGPVIVRLNFPHAAAPPLVAALDGRVLAFACGLALFVALLFGIVPALRATRTAPAGTLHARTATGHMPRARLDGALVVAQIALSVVLLVCATLFARSLHGLGTRDAGYDRENVLLFAVDPHAAGIAPADVAATYDALRTRLSALPGVTAATISVVRPVDDQFYFAGVIPAIDERAVQPDRPLRVAMNHVGPRFFETFRIPLRIGREFDERDRRGSRLVAVISETLARVAFPGQQPLGHTIDLEGPGGPEAHEIVGVAADIRYGSLKDTPREVVYTAARQADLGKAPFALSYALRTTVPPATLAGAVRQAVRETHARLPIDRMLTLSAQADASLARERVLASLSGYFGGLALLLVSLGLYGLMAYLVIQRTAEFGVRLALGATTGAVRALVLRRAGGLIVLGLLLGLPAAFAATRLLGSLVYGVTPRDPGSFGAAVALLAAGALLAVWLPARRAARVDPCVALRVD